MATNPTAPSYAWLVLQNYTTWPETWMAGSVAGAISLMHGTLNGFGLWFPQSLLGVRADPAAPGFQRFTIRPAYHSGIAGANGTVATPHGLVRVQWTALPVTLKVTIPWNSAATVYFPHGQGGRVIDIEAGRPAVQIDSSAFVGREGYSSVLQLGAGSYSLAVE